MRVLELAPQVYVTGQLFERDLKLIAKQDVRSIMDNRSADEALRQPLASGSCQGRGGVRDYLRTLPGRSRPDYRASG